MSSFIKDWTEKEVEKLAASFKRYRIFVFILKFILPLTAATLLVMIIFFAESDDKSAKIKVENLAAEKISPKDITSVGKMTNPRFQGLDAKNQPYSIKAQEAWQESKDEIIMSGITADITTADGKWMSAVANSGQYFMTQNKINLSDGVDIFITDENQKITQIQTESLHIDVKQSIASSDDEISVLSDLSNFSAKGFVADKEAEKITFKGPIKLVIVP